MMKSTDGPVSRYINRKMSNAITRFIVKHNIPLTPNQVSVISFLIGAAGAILFLFDQLILAGTLIQVSSVIDGVDGELARVLRKESRFGAFFDAMLDRFVDILAVALISVHFLSTSTFSPLSDTMIVVFAVAGTLMVSYIHARGEASLRTHPRFIGRIPNFASRDVRLFIIFVGAVIGAFWHLAILLTLLLIAALTNLYVVAKFVEISVHFYRMERERAGTENMSKYQEAETSP